MVKKPSDLKDGPVIVKTKSQGDSYLPQTLKVEMLNGQIEVNVLILAMEI